MAELTDEEVSSTAVAEHLGRRPNEAPAWGRVSFTLPYLAEFLRGESRPTRVS